MICQPFFAAALPRNFWNFESQPRWVSGMAGDGSNRGILTAFAAELRDFRQNIGSLLLLLLGPAFLVLLCGEALKSPEVNRGVGRYQDRDGSERSHALVQLLISTSKLNWQVIDAGVEWDLARDSAIAALVIPENWGEGLINGDPQPVRLIVDGSDPAAAEEVAWSVRQTLREYQQNALQEILDTLPDEVIALGKQLDPAVRKRFVSWMAAWTAEVEAKSPTRQLDFLLPGVIGMIFQAVGVMLMASRSTSGARSVWVRALAGLAVLAPAMALAFIAAAVRFGFSSGSIAGTAAVSVAFLACTVGIGSLLSVSFSVPLTRLQATVYYLVAAGVLSGAFFSVIRLPAVLEKLGYVFPLTWFCDVVRDAGSQQGGFGPALVTSGGLIVAAVAMCFAAAAIAERHLRVTEPAATR